MEALEAAEDFIELGFEAADHAAGHDYYNLPHHVKRPYKHIKTSRRFFPNGKPSGSTSPRNDEQQRHLTGSNTIPQGQYADVNTQPLQGRDREPYTPDLYAPNPYTQEPYPTPHPDERSSRRSRPRSDRRPSSVGAAPRSDRYSGSSGVPRGLLGGVGAGSAAGAGAMGSRYDDDNDGRRPRRAGSADRAHDRRERRSDSSDSYSSSNSVSDGGGREERRPRAPQGVRRLKKKKSTINVGAWGAVAGGLLGSEVMKNRSPILATFVGAAIGGIGGKVLEKRGGARDRERERDGRDERKRKSGDYRRTTADDYR